MPRTHQWMAVGRALLSRGGGGRGQAACRRVALLGILFALDGLGIPARLSAAELLAGELERVE